MMKVKLLIVFVALVFPLLGCSGADSKPETKGSVEARTRWWREAKFGMFIHWGVYAVPADSTKGIAEWYMYNHQVQVKDYEKFAA
ncbi:MAG: alpha-L-fucosidase, partial [Armatimonadetes bacterium]|nr:alpha-L-fucosidase [Armatimonadota bacterium]